MEVAFLVEKMARNHTRMLGCRHGGAYTRSLSTVHVQSISGFRSVLRAWGMNQTEPINIGD